MANYRRGKIYKITSAHGGLPYIGSCVISKERRLEKHKADFKRGLKLACHNHLSQPDCHIVLVQFFPCNSAIALRAQEQHYMDNLPNCNWNRAVAKEKYKEYTVLSKWSRLVDVIVEEANRIGK